MNNRFSNSFFSAVVSTIVFGASVLAADSAFATSSSANSQVGITKLSSVHVASMENSELILSNSTEQMQSATCIQSAGDDTPYRISASSLSDNNQFSVKGDDSVIPYQVSWANDTDSLWVLDSTNDQTGVLSATSTGNCALSTMSVQLNGNDFSNAREGVYTDTLSLMLVIE